LQLAKREKRRRRGREIVCGFEDEKEMREERKN